MFVKKKALTTFEQVNSAVQAQTCDYWTKVGATSEKRIDFIFRAIPPVAGR